MNILPKHINKRLIVVATGIVVAVGTGGVLAANSNSNDAPPAQKKDVTVDNKPDTQPVQDVSEQPARQVQQVEQQPQTSTEEEVVNPYQEGFNLWHVFNRRTATGKQVPADLPNEHTFCAKLGERSEYTVSTEPSLHAISCRAKMVGFVESVNPDGSFVVSYTNYTAGWNNYQEVVAQPADLPLYRFFQ